MVISWDVHYKPNGFVGIVIWQITQAPNGRLMIWEVYYATVRPEALEPIILTHFFQDLEVVLETTAWDIRREL